MFFGTVLVLSINCNLDMNCILDDNFIKPPITLYKIA